MKKSLLLVGSLLLRALYQPAAAQLVDPGFVAPTSVYAPGTVYSLGPTQADGKRVVAGTFTRVNGTAVSNLTRFEASGALDAAFQQRVGTASNVFRVRGLAGGQYLLGSSGGPIAVGGLVRNELLRLNADGSADASFDPANGPQLGGSSGYSQETVQQPDGKIVVLGGFDTFNGVLANGLVRLNSNGSVDTGFSVGTGFDTQNEYVPSLTLQPDGRLLIAGSMSVFNGQPVNGIVRLNSNGSIDNSFMTGALAGSYLQGLLLQPDGRVLVYGDVIINGAQGYSLARLNADGTLDGSFTALSSGIGVVYASFSNDSPLVLQPDGRIVALGSFNVNGIYYSVARFNADGTQDNSFLLANAPSAVPNTIALEPNGSVLLGGNLVRFNGSENPLGRLSSTGTPDLSLATTIQIDGQISQVVVQADGRAIVGGTLTEINGVAVHRVARLSSAGTVEAAYAAATGLLPGTVNKMLLQPDGKLLVGTTAGMARLTTGGSPDPGFLLSTKSNISTLALEADGRILANTNSIRSDGRNLFRFGSNGSYDFTFLRPLTSAGPGTPGIVDAIVVQPDGNIVVGGYFTPASQPTVARVVRYLPSGSLDATFDYSPTFSTGNAPTRLYTLARQPDGKLLAGGNISQVSGAARTGVVRLNATGGLDAGFVPNFTTLGTVNNVTVQPNGRILLGGNLSGTGTGLTFNYLGRVLTNGQYDASFGNTAEPNANVRSLAIQPDGGIMLAGTFTSLGGQPVLKLGRVVAADVLAVAAPAAVAARTSAWPVPAHGRLHVAPDARAQPQSLELLDALGRSLHQQPATAAPEQTLDLAGLPTGLYLLRVHYAAGTVTQRVSVY